MPALNTPQFDWVKSRLPRKPQPVPPIYQPEVGARAVVYAALHPERRDLTVGFSTERAIWGNRIAPRLLDRYLARTGYRLQQTDAPDPPSRPDNLWDPVPGNHGAHGRFDARARRHSPHLWLNEHRGAVLLIGAGAGLAAGAVVAWASHGGRARCAR